MQKDTKFNECRKEISDKLKNIWYNNGDLSDIGNEIGVIIAKHFDNDSMMGNDYDSFMHGLKHGISLVDGTHDAPNILINPYEKAIEYIQEAYCFDKNNFMPYLLLGDVAKVIEITTGQEVSVETLDKYKK